MMLTSDGPNSAASSSASMTIGKDRARSTTRIRMRSVHPPKYPATMPTVVPRRPPRRSRAPQTASETRAPWMQPAQDVAAKIVRAERCRSDPPVTHAGGASRSSSDPASGSAGAMIGASSAARMNRRRSRRARCGPSSDARKLLIARPRARADLPCIDEVHEEIHRDVERRDRQHDRLDHRKVAPQDGIQREAGRPRARRRRSRSPPLR